MAIKIQNSTIIDDNRNIVNAGITSVTSLTSQQLNVSGIATVNSNFIVNGSTLVVNATNNRVGVGTTNPQVSLDVVGNSRVSGILTATTFSGNLANTLTLSTSGTGLSGSATFNNSSASTFTVTSNATSDNTNSTIVSRNSSGGFSAGIITATFVGNLTGTATTANNLSNAANITTGTIDQARLSGNYNINVSYANTAGVATVAQGLTGTPNIFVGIATASSFVGNLTGNVTGNFNSTGINTISVNSSLDALRITQTGTGNALLVEDSTNPDATPFVVSSNGFVGIGTTNPGNSVINIQASAPVIFLRDNSSTVDNRIWRLVAQNQTLFLQALSDTSGGGGNLFQFSRNAEQIQTFEGLSGGNTWFEIDNSTQNVGIGTSIARTKLDVLGNASITGVTTAPTIYSTTGFITSISNTNINTSGVTTTARLNVGVGGTIITTTSSGFVGINTTVPGSMLAVGGTITELHAGQYWNVVTQADVGYGASQVPLNQYLGRLAFLDDFSPNGLRRDDGSEDDVIINSLGFVGIGTTNPQGSLQVGTGITMYSSTGFISATRYFGDGSQLSGLIPNTIQNVSSSSPFFPLLSPSSSGTISSLAVSSSNLVFIPSSGFIGIGTTNPQGSLQVGTGITMYGSSGIISAVQYFGDGSQLTGVTAIAFASPAGTNGQVQFNNSGTTGGARFFNYDSTNFRVGIGTSTPSARLSVSNSTSGNSLLIVNDNLSDGSLFRVSDNDGDLLLDVDSSGTILFPTSGNVGIGTTLANPSSKLHVVGDVRATNYYGNASNLINTVSISTSILNQSHYFTFITGIGSTSSLSTDASKLAFNPFTGNLGIGTTTPTARLSVSNSTSGNSLLLVNDNLSDGSLFRVSDNDGDLLLDVDSSGTILFPTSGNIGIGTTLANPSSKLHVVGDVRVGVNTSQGVILTSSNGTRYRLIVSDAGALSTVLVP